MTFTTLDNNFSTAKFIVNKTAGLGTHTTIQAAITAAAASGITQPLVFIQNGFYSENLTLSTGVNLCGYDGSIPQVQSGVVISGKMTFSSGGSFTIDNIRMSNAADNILTVSGSSNIYFTRCSFSPGGAFAAFLGSNCNLFFYQCNATDGGPGTGPFFSFTNASAATLYNCNFNGTTATASTLANTSSLTIYNSNYNAFLTTADTAVFKAYNSNLGIAAHTFLTAGGTSGNDEILNCEISSTSSSALSISTGATLTLTNSSVSSSNTNAITGAGTLKYGTVVFTGSSSTINTTTQTGLLLSVIQGGTSLTTLTAHALYVGNGTSAPTALAVGTTGQVLTASTGANPGWAANAAFTSTVNQVFTSSGTYTPTSGMLYCSVRCIGGGGGGGGAASTTAAQTAGGSGGGAGEYAEGIFSAATIGVSQTVTIGAAGAANSGANGGNGGTTSLGALITAGGGTGGVTTASSTVFNTAGSLGGTGGSGGDFRTPGGAGFYASGYVAGSMLLGGQGANSQLGAGGNATTANVSGVAALGNGAGGSGALNFVSQSARSGGAGTKGVIIITEYI